MARYPVAVCRFRRKFTTGWFSDEESSLNCNKNPPIKKSGIAMATFESAIHVRFAHLMVALPLVIAAIAISPVQAVAQGGDSDLSKQLSQLQAQVTRLEFALNHKPQDAASTPQQPSAEGNQANVQKQATPGVPEGMQIRATHQNCLQCHQTRPPGPLPPSHLEPLSGGGQGGTQAAGGQESSGAGMGQMAQGGQGMQGMDGGKGMGMMGGGMGMGGGKGMQGMGGGKGMGMGGGKGLQGMGQMAQGGQGNQAMGGGGSTESSSANPAEPQMKQMQQQIQQLQQQMQQMMQMQMQMQLIQMKMMQPN